MDLSCVLPFPALLAFCSGVASGSKVCTVVLAFAAASSVKISFALSWAREAAPLGGRELAMDMGEGEKYTRVRKRGG